MQLKVRWSRSAGRVARGFPPMFSVRNLDMATDGRRLEVVDEG